ncbi:1-hydroxycarotenoid 3,4-desaturase CrtD [Lentiprolixibacter aurantiacus]|uniref:Phytoene desaturase family protein n=1 Tax=Lentiprolixibacter aurantiacus TaxID=2993939 RepID=A0AAE3SNU2_9FLAO|nr:1-hydroxycarotenoid 3,4-desaturase CrtD [Lentiprolixibacter aurantiacus]MCX2720132.1 phytoene desaturase family protein [Lentiprolixibacter aurantiacus]
MPEAHIIGAGIGGLATALRLCKKGYEVSVFEANPYPGGKLHAIDLNGYRFDLGPSLFTMPQFIDELFLLFEKQPELHFKYKRKDILCEYFWDDETRFTARKNTHDFAKDAARAFDEDEETIRKYIGSNKKKYDLTAPLFLEQSLHKSKTYTSAKTLKALMSMPSLDVFGTLNGVNQRYFKHPKLVQLFNRYATYNGSSPYQTPGIMSMIPHLEMFFGTFFPEGGMHEIVMSLYRLAVSEGVHFHFDSKVDEILVDHGKASAIRVGDRVHNADLIVSNMDIYPTYRNLLPSQPAPEKTLAQERSSSALIFYWGVSKAFPELDLHNIFFSNDYQSEFDHIFRKKTLGNDPTVYINITSKDWPSDAPDGCENWFVMINAPGDHGQDWAEMKSRARKNIIRKLNQVLKTDLEPLIAVEHILDPPGIQNSTSSYRGALYGAASNSRFSAFLRHPNFSRKISNLYFCGGSVHPGGGIPLCLLSAKIISEMVPNPKMND